jgi:Bacteriophage HK97-gp10, putative tail-component
VSVKFTLGGIAVQRNSLKALPDLLAAKAQAALEARATTVAAEISAAYPKVTGALSSSLSVTSTPRKTKARVVIRSKLRRALAYEYGSVPRRTKKGAGRGRMPIGNVFVPRIMKARIDLVPRIAAIMRAEGLTVSGE